MGGGEWGRGCFFHWAIPSGLKIEAQSLFVDITDASSIVACAMVFLCPQCRKIKMVGTIGSQSP